MALALGLLLVCSFVLRLWLAGDELTGRRFWDERYGLENVRSLVLEHQLRPANGFHPSLAHLPEAAVLGTSHALYLATNVELFRIFDEKPKREPERGWVRQQHYTPTGYFLSRALQSVFGTLSLWLLFRVGRRMFSDQAALLSTLMLSAVFWHLRQSAIYKPDILLVLLLLWAFDASLEAARRPTLRSYLVAGGVIGLALSTKFNAGPIAIPLMWSTFAHRRSDRRVWTWLGAAGLTSIVVFLLLNPFVLTEPGIYQQNFGRTLTDYAAKGAKLGSSHLYVLWHGLLTLLSKNFHGWLLGGLGLLGALLLPFRGPDDPRAAHLGRSMALSYILGYSLLYSLSSTNASPHNWLLLTPFVALFSGAMGWQIWLWLAPLLKQYRSIVGVGLSAAIAVWLLFSSYLYVYRQVIPTTLERAEDFLSEHLRKVDQRVVLYEDDKDAGSSTLTVSRRGGVASPIGAERLSLFRPQGLDRADALVFDRRRLKEKNDPNSRLLQARVEAARPDELHFFEPRWLHSQGPERVVLIRLWRRGEKKQIPVTTVKVAAREAQIEIPSGVRPKSILTLELDPPRGRQIDEVTVDGVIVPHTLIRRRRHRYFRTARFKLPSSKSEIQVRFVPGRRGPSKRREILGSLIVWHPPKGRKRK